jgi:hypothetical protein
MLQMIRAYNISAGRGDNGNGDVARNLGLHPRACWAKDGGASSCAFNQM